MKHKALFTIFLIVFMDLLGFGILLPLLPFIAEKYAANPLEIGFLTAAYSLFQFIATPLLGRLSDRYGRKKILVISQLGSVVGYLLLGWANSLPILFLSRIIDGATGGNISVAQAYIADVTTKENRAKGMGLIGAAFGLGFIVGPALGGYLARFGFAVPAYAAAGVGLVTVVATAVFLKETVNVTRAVRSPRTRLSYDEVCRVLKTKPIGLLILTFFVLNTAFSVMQGNFALWTQAAFRFGAEENAWLFTGMGIMSVIMQLRVLPWVVGTFKEAMALKFAIFVLGAGFLLLPLAVSPIWVLGALLFFSLGQGLSMPTIQAIASERVPKEEYGETLGILQSAGSLGRIIGPIAGGELFYQFGHNTPFFVAGFLVLVMGGVVWAKLESR